MSTLDNEMKQINLDFTSLKEIYLSYFNEREQDPTRGMKQEDKFTLDFLHKTFFLVEKQNKMLQVREYFIVIDTNEGKDKFRRRVELQETSPG